jgi:formylglycine-generating enzyme required for sulfatase activity
MSKLLCVLLSLVLLVCLQRETVLAQDADLADQVQAILKSRCAGCHDGGTNEGGFGYVLSRRRLVRQNGPVVPGSPRESRLYQQVRDDKMPDDGDPLTKDQKETIRRWIEAGAPNWEAEQTGEFITPEQMFAFMRADLEKEIPRNRQYLRYFTITHLKNAGYSDGELASYRNGLTKLVNSLSWGRTVRIPKPIDPQRTILRIDLRHYKWNQNGAWDAVIAADRYHVEYQYPAAKYCYKETGCALPHVRADWFVHAASRPPLYHEILEIPETDVALEKRLEVNVAQNIRDFLVARAGFYPSGISKSNRLIEWHESSDGSYWKSYDFAGNEGRQNLRSHPLGPGSDSQSFQHDGGEIIFSLPNGLQGYMLVDAEGKRIPKGPTNIVVDKLSVAAGREPDVLNGVSCMRCHWSGMLRKTDQIRNHVIGQKAAFSEREVEIVEALYPPAAEFNVLFKESEEQFADAVKDCGVPLSRSEPVATLADEFEQPLDLALAAAEAGVDIAGFRQALQRDPEIARALGVPIPRDTYVRNFGRLATATRTGKFIPASVTNSIGMKLKLIPADEFQMGSPDSEKDRDDDETQHRVRITKPFYLQTTEVTQGQWQSVMGTKPWSGKTYVKEGAEYPATYVSHGLNAEGTVEPDSATEFCRKLSAKEGVAYRLPTEAEWEYACRGGSTSMYSFGDSLGSLKDYAWFDENAWDIGEKYAHRVGQKRANGFGLYDMHGNVYEWCSDRYGEDYYKSSPLADPRGPSNGHQRWRTGPTDEAQTESRRKTGQDRWHPAEPVTQIPTVKRVELDEVSPFPA